MDLAGTCQAHGGSINTDSPEADVPGHDDCHGEVYQGAALAGKNEDRQPCHLQRGYPKQGGA